MMNLINMMAIIIIIFNNIKIILSIEGSGMPLKREENPGYKEKLGLLKKVGKIEVKKGMENMIMSILFPSNHSYIEYDNLIRIIKNDIKKILKIPALEKSGKYFKTNEGHFSNIDINLEFIEKSLNDISKFHNDQPITTKQYTCDLEFARIEPEFIQEYVTSIDTLIKPLDLTATYETFEKPETKDKYNLFLTNILLIKNLVADLKNAIVERIKAMDNLANGKVPDDLIFMLQTKNCMPNGQLENLEINFCHKTSIGLFCELQINIYKSVQEYDKYIPVVYKGVQLRAESTDQLFVKSGNNWGLIDCEENIDPEYDDNDNVIDLFNECNFKHYENACIKAIEKDNFSIILKECNFTHVSAQPVWRTETGILIMDTETKLTIQELNPIDNRLQAFLPNKFPVHIISNKNLNVQFNDKHIVYTPTQTNTVTSIVYTYLSDEFIQSIIKSAEYSDLISGLTTKEYIDLTFLLLFIILVPIILTLCCIGIKRSEIWEKCKESKAQKIYNRTRKISKNFSENKRMMKEMRQK